MALDIPLLKAHQEPLTDAHLNDALTVLLRDLRCVHVHDQPGRAAATAPLTPTVSTLAPILPASGLWTHQVEAIELLRARQSVVLSTGTASGKTLAYQLPVMEAAASGSTTLALFPTKALAHDQLRRFLDASATVESNLQNHVGADESTAAVTSGQHRSAVFAALDGDSTFDERSFIQESGDVIFTNPDMVHYHLLPRHDLFHGFLKQLRYVVVDELHTLRGVFGSHVAHILRRLRRLVIAHGGTEPTFVFTSATLGNADRLASEMSGVPVTAMTTDGSPRGHRSVALWNPAQLVPDSWSVNDESSRLATALIASGLRTIVFSKSRRSTEVIAANIASRLEDLGRSDLLIQSYRSGYLPEERRGIEDALRTNQLHGIVATSALELGVDFTGLDAAVLCGYPGTTAGLWQQIGRSGRSQQPSLAILVADQNQLDQWVMNNPHEFFERSPEPAIINAQNPLISLPHIGCATAEWPVTPSDHAYWPDQLDEAMGELLRTDRVRFKPSTSPPQAVWVGRGSPAGSIALRSAGLGEIQIITDNGRLVGTADGDQAMQSLHPGAMYMHQGQHWEVIHLDSNYATVIPADGKTYTQALKTTTVSILRTDQQQRLGNDHVVCGNVEVVNQLTGYELRDVRTRRIIKKYDLDYDPRSLRTRALWFTLGDACERAEMMSDDLPGALHALEHAAIGILPLLTICDRWDVGGVSSALLPDTGQPTIVIHDAVPAGSGVSELAYGQIEKLLRQTHKVIGDCPCEDGCPSCVQSPKCGSGNSPLYKAGALSLLRAVIAGVDRQSS